MIRLPDDGKVTHNEFFSLQQEGTLVFRRLPTLQAAEHAVATNHQQDDIDQSAKGQTAVWIGKPGLTVLEASDHHILIESAKTYIAVTVARGGLTAETDGPRNGQYALFSETATAGAIEVTPKTEFSSRQELLDAYRTTPRFKSDDNADQYMPLRGNPVTLHRDLYAPENARGFLDAENEPFLYQSPFVTAKIGSSVVTLSFDTTKVELAFNP